MSPQELQELRQEELEQIEMQVLSQLAHDVGEVDWELLEAVAEVRTK